MRNWRIVRSFVQPDDRDCCPTLVAVTNAARIGARRDEGWAARASRACFGVLSLAPKPLPSFHGLSTGVGTYSSTNQPARSGTVVARTIPSAVHRAVASGSACSATTRNKPRPAR